LPEVRKENSDTLDYVCPECGDTFEEGAEECASCGLEFDWTEEMEYLCPECGTVVDPDQARCPGCSAKFSMHDDGEITIEYEPDKPPATDEALLEAAIDEVIVRPNGVAVLSEEDDDDVKELGLSDAAPPPTVPENVPEPAPEVEAPTEAKTNGRAKASAEATYPRLYPGGFTLVGMVFIVLALLALVFTIVVARYDTWIQGASEESMGDNQLTMFYAGLAAFTVFVMIAIIDLLKTPRAKPTG
jgi:DNA-directed RNA polymerase subunit RPC12/RpoP